MLQQLPPRDDDGNVNVIIETPRDSVHKFAFDAERGVFVLKKSLPLGMAFPYDFGFVPGTSADDGDPLDVLMLLDGVTPPGVLVASRLIGAVEVADVDGKRNDRLIAVGVKSRRYGHLQSLGELPPDVVDDLELFFVNYGAALGKPITPLGRTDAAGAERLLDAATERLVRRGNTRGKKAREKGA